MMTERSLGLYVHIPFCRSKCLYCDFYSCVGQEALLPRYVDALLREAAARPADGYTVGTLYLGGGTPSLLPPHELARLLRGLAARYAIASDAEITLEANPGTVTRGSLAAYRESGVNRLSLGVQSLSDRALAAIGRRHTARDAVAAVTAAREAGFDNVSLDLMVGLPYETPAVREETLRALLALAPEHISAYALTVAEGTPLATSPLLAHLPSEDDFAEALEATTAMLTAAGYRHYEISNYAIHGFESRHNLGYWQGHEYIGLGAAAHSYFAGERFGNTPSLPLYLAGQHRKEECERIDTRERERECLMLSLRTADGVDVAAYTAAFGRSPLCLFGEYFKEHPTLFTVSRERFALTEKGLMVFNTLLAELLLLLDRADGIEE